MQNDVQRENKYYVFILIGENAYPKSIHDRSYIFDWLSSFVSPDEQ